MSLEAGTDEICAICLMTIEKKNVCFTSCNHTFHLTCLLKTLEYTIICPICRTKIADKKIATQTETETQSISVPRWNDELNTSTPVYRRHRIHQARRYLYRNRQRNRNRSEHTTTSIASTIHINIRKLLVLITGTSRSTRQ